MRARALFSPLVCGFLNWGFPYMSEALLVADILIACYWLRQFGNMERVRTLGTCWAMICGLGGLGRPARVSGLVRPPVALGFWLTLAGPGSRADSRSSSNLPIFPEIPPDSAILAPIQADSLGFPGFRALSGPLGE